MTNKHSHIIAMVQALGVTFLFREPDDLIGDVLSEDFADHIRSTNENAQNEYSDSPSLQTQSVPLTA